jgi:hypothetical protein
MGPLSKKMDSMKAVVRQVVAGYAGKGLNSMSYLTQSEDGSVLTVTDFAWIRGEHISGVSLMVRIVGDVIIVERDQNDKILKDALLQAGIPREKIILAYSDEPIPETAL